MLTNAVAYVWPVSTAVPALQKKLNQSSFTCSAMFRIQVRWVNTMANKIEATKATHLLLYKYANTKKQKQSLLTQHMIFQRKCFSCYILLTDQISIISLHLFLEILSNMCIATVC